MTRNNQDYEIYILKKAVIVVRYATANTPYWIDTAKIVH